MKGEWLGAPGRRRPVASKSRVGVERHHRAPVERRDRRAPDRPAPPPGGFRARVPPHPRNSRAPRERSAARPRRSRNTAACRHAARAEGASPPPCRPARIPPHSPRSDAEQRPLAAHAPGVEAVIDVMEAAVDQATVEPALQDRGRPEPPEREVKDDHVRQLDLGDLPGDVRGRCPSAAAASWAFSGSNRPAWLGKSGAPRPGRSPWRRGRTTAPAPRRLGPRRARLRPAAPQNDRRSGCASTIRTVFASGIFIFLKIRISEHRQRTRQRPE
jgi:hypothetical protein